MTHETGFNMLVKHMWSAMTHGSEVSSIWKRVCSSYGWPNVPIKLNGGFHTSELANKFGSWIILRKKKMANKYCNFCPDGNEQKRLWLPRQERYDSWTVAIQGHDHRDIMKVNKNKCLKLSSVLGSHFTCQGKIKKKKVH